MWCTHVQVLVEVRYYFSLPAADIVCITSQNDSVHSARVIFITPASFAIYFLWKE